MSEHDRNDTMGCAHMFAAAFIVFVALLIVMIAKSSIEYWPPSSEPPSNRSLAEEARDTCRFLKTRYARTPLGQIPLEDADLIGNCRKLGLW